MRDFGTFERGGRQRRAATPAQAVKLTHDGWRKVKPAKPHRPRPRPAETEQPGLAGLAVPASTDNATDAKHGTVKAEKAVEAGES